jgi:PII-like signaling protein
MEIKGEAKLLRIFISNTDKFKHSLLSETIVFAARRYGLAGATALKGIMGYGSSSVIRSSKFWEITEKLPIVIEIVDESDRIERFVEKILPWFEKLRYGCMITVEKVNIVLYKQGTKKGFFNF